MSNPISAVAGAGKAIANAIAGPGKSRAALAAKLIEAGMSAEEAIQQVNLAEAKHSSIFVAGARPALLWLCVLGLGAILLLGVVHALGGPVNTEALALLRADTMEVLGWLLGVGYAARTAEHMAGVSKSALYTPKELAKVERYRAATAAKHGDKD